MLVRAKNKLELQDRPQAAAAAMSTTSLFIAIFVFRLKFRVNDASVHDKILSTKC